jgi:hypothetical protein
LQKHKPNPCGVGEQMEIVRQLNEDKVVGEINIGEDYELQNLTFFKKATKSCHPDGNVVC